MERKKVLVTIVNHNFNEGAINLKHILSTFFDTIIIDSCSSKQLDEFDIKLSNVYYSGLFNQSVKEMISRNYDWLLFICSDVVIKKNDIKKLKEYINDLPDDIGVYSPSSNGQSHKHCKNLHSNNIRDVIFVEGFMFLANKTIIQKIYPIDTNINKLGHGIDAYKGYLCLQDNKRCVIDDRITIYHQEGTGYNTTEASNQFIKWMSEPQMKGFYNFWNTYLYCETDSKETLKLLNEKNSNISTK